MPCLCQPIDEEPQEQQRAPDDNRAEQRDPDVLRTAIGEPIHMGARVGANPDPEAIVQLRGVVERVVQCRRGQEKPAISEDCPAGVSVRPAGLVVPVIEDRNYRHEQRQGAAVPDRGDALVLQVQLGGGVKDRCGDDLRRKSPSQYECERAKQQCVGDADRLVQPANRVGIDRNGAHHAISIEHGLLMEVSRPHAVRKTGSCMTTARRHVGVHDKSGI